MKAYAGFWQRVKAFTYDYFIIVFYLIIASLATLLLFLLVNPIFDVGQWLFTDRIRAQVFSFLLITFPITMYFALGESSVRQATRGKQRLGLKIADRNGNRIGFWRAFTRTILKFIPWEISHTLLWGFYFSQESFQVSIDYGIALVYALIGLNIVSLVMTKTKQTLYDLAAGTYITIQQEL